MRRLALALVSLALTLGTGCTMHSYARVWNGRVGADGEPVWVQSTTNVGFNFLIFVPVIGSTTMEAMVDDLTGQIATESGDNVRIIESSAETYWYGWPPLTWIITPVVTTVTADYRPSAEALEQERQKQAADADS